MTSALALVMATPAHASDVAKKTLSESNIAAIFDVDSQLQIELLSEEEMAQTKCAVWPFVTNWASRMF